MSKRSLNIVLDGLTNRLYTVFIVKCTKFMSCFIENKYNKKTLKIVTMCLKKFKCVSLLELLIN